MTAVTSLTQCLGYCRPQTAHTAAKIINSHWFFNQCL